MCGERCMAMLLWWPWFATVILVSRRSAELRLRLALCCCGGGSCCGRYNVDIFDVDVLVVELECPVICVDESSASAEEDDPDPPL